MLLFGATDPFDATRRKRSALDVRTPEGQAVSRDDGDEHAPIWSVPIEKAIRNWYDAKQVGDEGALKKAAREAIDATYGHFRMSGMPAFAHFPLPPQLVEAEIREAEAAPADQRHDAISKFIDLFDDDARPLVLQQVQSHLAQADDRPTRSTADGGERDDEQVPHTALMRSLLNEGAGSSSTPGSAIASVYRPADDKAPSLRLARPRENVDASALESSAERDPFEQVQYAQHGPQGAHPQEPRIVRPYRKYQTPGVSADNDVEMQDADTLAIEADKSIWPAKRALDRDRSFATSSDPLDREFDAAMRRFFSVGSDRAVVGVGTRFPETGLGARDRYATYDPSSDRIYFSEAFSGLSGPEKTITVIHEVLHATGTIKNWEARIGYKPNTADAKTIRAHEAQLDRIAIAYAKRLGLIPGNYPSP